ncbi:iron ABC transporter substrate-binding protein [Corynebacterium pilosum]|uniref:Iron ABC transporter substrate-binding protein n=2 Tax=Corynebacterium pilosum TaxID=35756 RepID=A0A376CID7_9CORY|nr:iron ABC transporter substrate-binding protein [Corynebacterium pilosum]
MGRKRIAALCAAAAVILTSACSTSEEPSGAVGNSASGVEVSMESTASSSNDALRTVTDSLGREVEVPARVETVATQGSAARNVIYAGGLDKIVAVTETDQGPDVGAPYKYAGREIFEDLPVTGPGGPAQTTYEESLIEVDPDLMVTTWSDPAMLDQIQDRTGVPVIAVSDPAPDYSAFSEVNAEMILLLGELLGTEEQSQALVDKIQEWEKDLTGRVADLSEDEVKTAYTGAVSFRGAHGFAGTRAHYMPFDTVKVINVVDETGQDGPFQADLEKVPEWDPDFIFLNPANMDLVNEDYANNPEFFDSLTAVKEGRVYSQPSFIWHALNHEMAVANTYYVGKVVYPERFADVEMKQIVDEVFRAYLGMEYADLLKQEGLWFQELTLGEDVQ